MKFFEGITTLNDLRREYRRLAMIYHPDKGGDTAIMQAINSQYERLSKTLINGNPDFSEARKHFEQEVSEEIRQMIDRVLFLSNLAQIEVIGGWIWITGNTFPLRTTLLDLGFRFSHAKTAWYWHKGEYRKKNGKLLTMDEMRDLFGYQKVQSQHQPSNHLK
jgi:curved DNA-binding protein CbpA